ncbi:hypothetical protein BDQ17DRAFT_1364991 [Cyathus striatus]|nr:hypothetical protein BDQ17DRAFT_1364991 [Cyathus striatus]
MVNATSPLKPNPDATAPRYAKSAKLSEHSKDLSAPPATSIKDCSSSHNYDDYAAEFKANIDAYNREAFDQWQASHYAFDFPKAGGRGGTIEFLKEFVPSPKNIATLAGNIPSKSMTYGSIAKLLNECQKDLPSSKKIAFTDTSTLKLPGPAGCDHFTGPGILGLYPGQPVHISNHSWDKYSLAIEVKFDADPVNQPANKVPADNRNVETIAQLVKNGRNLLFASSSCYAFVRGLGSSGMLARSRLLID